MEGGAGAEAAKGIDGASKAEEAPGGKRPKDEEEGGRQGESSDIQTKISDVGEAAIPRVSVTAATEEEESEDGGEVEVAGYVEIEDVGGP